MLVREYNSKLYLGFIYQDTSRHADLPPIYTIIHETLVSAKRISEQVEFTSHFEFSGGKSFLLELYIQNLPTLVVQSKSGFCPIDFTA